MIAPASAQLPFGGQNPFGGIKDQIKEKAFVKAANLLLNGELPIKLDATTAFPTVTTPPGGPFTPHHLTVTPGMLSQPLAPGDYVVNLTAFCTEYSVHRPGRGVAYKLAPLQGRLSGAVATLLWRGMQAGVAPRHLMGVAWGIQSGLTYSEMPRPFQATIDQLIPDFKGQLSGDFIQKLEDLYQTYSRGTKMPPLDVELEKMGGPGKVALAAKRQRESLLAKDTTDEIREQRLFAGQESGVYTPVQAEEGPWTVRVPGLAYMRYKIEGGNLESNNIVEIRIVGSAPQAGLQNAPRLTNASYSPGQSDYDSQTRTATLLSLLGAQKLANGIIANGLIGYSQGQGAQALIPVLPKPITCTTAPCPGDIVVYRNASTPYYTHVAVIAEGGVRRDTPDGPATITKVLSKWGDLGLYGHDPDDSISYGKDWTVYHSARGSNELVLDSDGIYRTDPPASNRITVVKPDGSHSTEDDVRRIADSKCSGLYELLEKHPEVPSETWPLFDCRGYVFASGKVRIDGVGDNWNNFWKGDQIAEILRDNGYSMVPAKHTGGYACPSETSVVASQ